MSIASGITALVSALTTALNARNGVIGPSDYQMWLAQGNTGTIDNYRASILGADEDFATYFTSQIGATPSVSIASDTQAGVTQLATLAEAVAGTNAAKVMSAVRHSNVHIATTPAELNTRVATLPAGSIIALAPYDFGGTTGALYRSVWWVTGGFATPLLPLITSSGATLTYMSDNTGSGKTLDKLYLDPYVTQGISSLSGNLREEWTYTGVTGSVWTRNIPQYAHAYAIATGSQGFSDSTLTQIYTVQSVYDSSRITPANSGGSYWKLPWVGMYRMTIGFTLDGATTSGQYLGIGVIIASTSTSLADVGNKGGQSANDAVEFTAVFSNDTAGRNVNPCIYHQAGATRNTVGPFTAASNKGTRVTLEYLGS